jgi:tetratricopeptide (TPR) repeat protein
LQGQKAFDALSTCPVLKIQGAGLTAEAAAVKTGLGWLAKRKADVLVFGEVLPKGEAFNLHFLSSGREPNFTATSFRLETGLLRQDFEEAAASQLQAVALAAVRPATEEEGKYLVKTLRPVVAQLKRIAESPPPGISPSGMATMQFALGQALSVIGNQAGDNRALQKAVEAYREALKEWTRERVPLDWAGTQNNLGNALGALGERESGTETLQKAVEAYREALKEWTKEAAPYWHNIAQQNLDRANASLTQRRGNK